MKGSFLWRYRVVLTSAALLLLSLHLLSTGVGPADRAAVPPSLLLEALMPVQAAAAGAINGATGLFTVYLDLVNAADENRRLRSELGKLQAERTRLRELEIENARLSKLLRLRAALGINAIAADVIGGDATGMARTLIIAKGSRDGLKPAMAVIAEAGVVGRIIATSPDASRVLLIDDHNSALDTFDQRSRARGIIAGVVDDGLRMKYVDRSEDVRKGDTVITSGLDGIFSRGLLVGEVADVRAKGRGLFLEVNVKPAVDFHKLERVLVVTRQSAPVAAARRR